jgi:NADPH:quinone reductase-like Zn-dependent oxidoreductase
VDFKIREGFLKERLPNVFPIILGWDFSGVVEEVGGSVTGYKAGEPVFGYARKDTIHDGCYAEYIAVSPKHLCLKPNNLSDAEAAAVPLAALTAYQALYEGLRLQESESILIHAGAGGVGGFAIQLAKGAGAHVITTASARNHEYVRSLGADDVIDYDQVDFVRAIREKHPEGIDLVFDTVGGDVQRRSADVLHPEGRLTSILALDEEFFKQRELVATYVFVRPEAGQLLYLKKLLEGGHLKVTLANVLPLEEVARAHELIESRHVRGKIVLQIV